MYIQITTKCNMTCDHCCCMCRPGAGKHMDRSTWCDAIVFAREYGEESIAIGGGEPTLHPEFFDILSYALNEFDYVWLATNGSKIRTMRRLYKILNHEDKEVYQEGKLTVALSTDYYHARDKVNPWVFDTWKRNAKRQGYELRDVSRNIVAAGRAKKTGVWSKLDDKNNCVCSDIFINPDGDIKPCGCLDSPVIGNVRTGVDPAWERLLRASQEYNDYRCYKALNLKRRK